MVAPSDTRATLYDRVAAGKGLKLDARDLWDRPPRERVYCLVCRKLAEPYRRRTCWCCYAASRARFGLPMEDAA